MKYNIIGDIHGRTCWKNLIIPEATNIFAGDYFSPYDPISFKDCKKNFLEIIEYKKEHAETVLLYGNHDLEYSVLSEAYSRHDFQNANKIKHLFLDNKQYFQMAYSIENKVLVTHAGVTFPWYCLMFRDEVKKFVLQDLISVDALKDYIDSFNEEDPYNRELFEYNFNSRFNNHLIPVLFEDNVIGLYDNKTDTYIKKFSIEPDSVAKHINDNFLSDPDNYSFERHGMRYDYSGTTPTHSCVWVRPQSLYDNNLYIKSNFIQVVGHTQLSRWEMDEKIYFVDNLGSTTPTSLIYENELITKNILK